MGICHVVDAGDVLENDPLSGHLFDSVSTITLNDWHGIYPGLSAMLTSLGVTSIAPVGSTGIKPTMGDIDLAVEHPVSRDSLFESIQKHFLARKVGPDIVSVKYPLGDERWVQVDLMVGSIPFLTWSRAGSTDEDVKNSCRALLMNAILRFMSKTIPTTHDNPHYDRTRFALDFGSGLYISDQTRRGRAPGVVLKEWKTLSRTFVTSDPQQIVDLMLGPNVELKTTYSFSSFLQAFKDSPIWTKSTRKLIIDTFLLELEQLSLKRPGAYGDTKKVRHLVLA